MGSTSLTSTTSAVFNPAITSKEIIDQREANLGFEATVSRVYRDEAGVGTTIAWPVISAIAAATKTEGNTNPIAYTSPTETDVTLTINQHQYGAIELEEFEEALALHDLESIYRRRIIFGVNLAIDDSLAALVDDFSQVVGTLAVPLVDDDVRRAVQYLDDANAPTEGRYFAMSPATKNSMLSIDRYNSSDFVSSSGGGNIVRGSFGTIYGLTVWNSTNIEGSNAAGHDNGIYQRDAIALALRMSVRVRTFDDIDNLSSKLAASAIWGVIETRDDHGVWARGA